MATKRTGGRKPGDTNYSLREEKYLAENYAPQSRKSRSEGKNQGHGCQAQGDSRQAQEEVSLLGHAQRNRLSMPNNHRMP